MPGIYRIPPPQTRLPSTRWLTWVDPVLAYARPDGDVTDGSWTRDDGGNTDLYSRIDETTPSDADYIKSSDLSAGGSDTCELALGNVSDPGQDGYHRLRYRFRKQNVQGDPRVDLEIRLIQGTTTIATRTEQNISTDWFDGVLTLTSAEAASISDYNDLRVRFTASVT